MMEQLSKDNMRRPHDFDTARRPGEEDTRVRPLPIGHRLGELQLDAVLGVGGFGIVYRAFDRALQRVVAIKEYMPSMLATRGGDHTVSLRSERFVQAFDAGRAAFVNEARLLAQFDHPGLVKVLHFWEAHGTAYMAMPFYEGWTLKQSVDSGARFGEAKLHEILDGVLGALDTLHRAQCFHRDISLDNILIRTDGTPVLLDFGAARRSIGDLVDDRAVMLKPGYAPIEQYTDDPVFTQGPWTDIYGLGAVIHAAITGELPPPAVVRSIEDKYQPLATRAMPDREQYSRRFLTAIDHALQLRISDRPESIAVFANELGIDGFEQAPHGTSQHEDDGRAAGPSLGVVPEAQPPDAHPTIAPIPGDELTVRVPGTNRPAQEQEPADLGEGSTAANRTVQIEPPRVARDASAADASADDRQRVAGSRRLPRKRITLYGAGALALLLVAAIAMIVSGGQRTRAPAAPSTVARNTGAPPAVAPARQAPVPVASATVAVAPVTPRASEPAPTPAAMASVPTAAAQTGPVQRSIADGIAEASSAGVPAASLEGSESVVAIAPTRAASATPSAAASAIAVSAVAVAEVPPAVPKPVETARVRIKVKPWGEVYVDGIKRGVSPPLRVLSLAPGAHEIEIRNGNLRPLQRRVAIDAIGKPIDLDFTFD